MAHIDLTQPNRRSRRIPPADKNGAEDSETSLEFIPITGDASSAATNTDSSATTPPPAGEPESTVNAVPKEPPTASAPPASAETAETPKKSGKRGRPPKGASSAAGQSHESRPAASKPQKGSDERRKQVNFYMEETEHRNLRFYCFQQNRTFTDLMETLATAVLNSGYRCREAGCNCEFVICSTLSDDTPRCPACGSKRIDPLVSH